MSTYPASRETLLALFDRVSLVERIRRIRFGLRQPRHTGAYKVARQDLLNGVAWLAALLVPAFAFLVLIVVSMIVPELPPTHPAARLMSPPRDQVLTEPEPIVRRDLVEPMVAAASVADLVEPTAPPAAAPAAPSPPANVQSPPVALNRSPLHVPLPALGHGLGRRCRATGIETVVGSRC